jgi:ribosomal protein S18 acetylase RimI-like enzyme
VTDPTIRRYEAGDAEAVQALAERAMIGEGTDSEDIPGIDDLTRIEAAYLDSGGEFLVAEVDGSIAGMGGLLVEGETGELMRMRVDPIAQREGLGSQLLDRLEAAARERGLDRLVAETAVRQAAATEFYPAHGFTEQSRRSFESYELITFEKRL